MARKSNTATVKFLVGHGQSMVMHTGVVHKKIPLKENALRFIHLELKGNTWVLLNALDMTGTPDTIKLEFSREGDVAAVCFDNRRMEIGLYTTLKLDSCSFYHLDELPNGTWRTTHTENFLPCEHKLIKEILISKETPAE